MNIKSKVKVRVRVRVRRSSGWRELCTSIECSSNSTDFNLFAIVVDYLQPGDVTDASSSSELLDLARLDRYAPSPDLRRPHSNIIQPAAGFQEPLAALPRPGEKEKLDGNDDDDDGKTVASVNDEEEDAGYSSWLDDGDEDAN